MNVLFYNWNQKFQLNLDQQFSIHTMTRSTELESELVSTTRYETQNAERESLLSQNWTASIEEDMNASLNIEEKNTNALLFNHKMIKISISTKLNAWISTHEADDLVAFIKYMSSKSRFTMTWFRCWMTSTRSTLNWKLRKQHWTLFERIYRKRWRKKMWLYII